MIATRTSGDATARHPPSLHLELVFAKAIRAPELPGLYGRRTHGPRAVTFPAPVDSRKCQGCPVDGEYHFRECWKSTANIRKCIGYRLTDRVAV